MSDSYNSRCPCGSDVYEARYSEGMTRVWCHHCHATAAWRDGVANAGEAKACWEAYCHLANGGSKRREATSRAQFTAEQFHTLIDRVEKLEWMLSPPKADAPPRRQGLILVSEDNLASLRQDLAWNKKQVQLGIDEYRKLQDALVGARDEIDRLKAALDGPGESVTDVANKAQRAEEIYRTNLQRANDMIYQLKADKDELTAQLGSASRGQMMSDIVNQERMAIYTAANGVIPGSNQMMVPALAGAIREKIDQLIRSAEDKDATLARLKEELSDTQTILAEKRREIERLSKQVGPHEDTHL